MVAMVLQIFCIYLIFINDAVCRFVEIPSEKKLRDYLLTRYDWHVRPVKNHTDQLIVFARFKLERIASLVKDNKYFCTNYINLLLCSDCPCFFQDLKDQVISLNMIIEQVRYVNQNKSFLLYSYLFYKSAHFKFTEMDRL